jgi:8-oxo-dGTP pyrophosphatase MutT (NUDIX family)
MGSVALSGTGPGATMVIMNAGDLGPVDPTLDPAAVLGRPGTFTLMARGWLPPADEVTQSYGLCFTAEGRVVLIADPYLGWSLPGGTVEPGKEDVDTLVREVSEETRARVIAAEYLASQHVHDPENPDGQTSYFQSRWWARVELDEWNRRFETTSVALSHRRTWRGRFPGATRRSSRGS